MPTNSGDGPLPGDLVLHTCNGFARWWRPAEGPQACACGSPLAGDLPPRAGHAQVYCDACRKWIGVCASDELAEVAEGAHRLIVAANRNRRQGG